MTLPVSYIDPPGTAPAQGLYSHIGKPAGGGLIFIAGQLSVDTAGNIVGEHDFAAQFDQVFRNLGDVLAGPNRPAPRLPTRASRPATGS